MNVPDVYEFAVTPNATYIIAENGPNVLRIYTDGRRHPPADELWPTYNGASVGHWEGDTLVFTTISLKGASGDDVIVDRTGLVLSDASRATTRMRKIDDKTIEAQITIEDPKAYTKPFTVRVNQQIAPDDEIIEFICNENEQSSQHLVAPKISHTVETARSIVSSIDLTSASTPDRPSRT